MIKAITYLIALILLSILCGLFARFILGSQNPLENTARGIGLAAVGLLVFSGLAAAARKWSTGTWILAGLFVLLGLFIPPSAALKIFPASGPEPYGSSEAFSLFLIASIAFIAAALLLYSGQTLYRAWQPASVGEAVDSHVRRSLAGKMAVVLLLAALLLVKALQRVYWATVWDSTTDPLGYFWLFFPILAAIFAGFLWSYLLAGKMKLVGFLVGFGYSAVITVLLIVVSARAQQVDFRQLTRERAERVSQAIESYHARSGRYPQNLGQLSPWNALWLPEPVIIFGQGWCYDGGDAYYRLGYVDRDHWSDPHLIGRIYKTEGQLPALQRTCEKEITALQSRDPKFPMYTYWKETN